MRHWIQGIILFLLCSFLIVGTIVYFQWKRFLNTSLNKSPTAFVLQVKSGQSMKQVAWNLKKQNRLSSPRFFTWLAHLKDASHRIKAGHYLVLPGVTPNELIEKMISGEVILSRFTIVDGWTFERLMKKIQESPHFSHTLKEVTPDALMAQLGAKGLSPEGQFYPDTYLFHQGTTDIEILKKAYQKMQTAIQDAWKNRDPSLPYKTPQEALIAASLIQKETRLLEEYPKISAVIRNRLNKGMALQIDPTVIYGLGERYVYPLTQKQLLLDTPYNTYTRKGLPPTPIAMVNVKAFYAALHPDASDVLYFVANGQGGHTFSNQFEDHRTAVSHYRKQEKQQKKQLGKPSVQYCIWILGFGAYAK